MSFTALLLLGAIAAAPDVVGADAPQATKTYVSERGDPESAGDTTATCRVYRDFAVVVFDAPLTKGIEGVEVRDRATGVTAKALCAKDFAGPKRTLMAGEEREYGYFLAVKGPVVLMRGDDGFGAHDRLAIYRASDGARLLETVRFDSAPLRIDVDNGAVRLRFVQALDVACDPRGSTHPAKHTGCAVLLRRRNAIPDDVTLDLDVTRACRRIPLEASPQLGVPVVVRVDGAGASTRFVDGRVVCAAEP